MAEKQGPEITSSGFYEKLWEDINKAVAVTVTMPEGVEVTYTPARIEREGDGETADPEAVEAGSPIPQPFDLFYVSDSSPAEVAGAHWNVCMRSPREDLTIRANMTRKSAVTIRNVLNEAAFDFLDRQVCEFINREKGGCCGRSG